MSHGECVTAAEVEEGGFLAWYSGVLCYEFSYTYPRSGMGSVEPLSRASAAMVAVQLGGLGRGGGVILAILTLSQARGVWGRCRARRERWARGVAGWWVVSSPCPSVAASFHMTPFAGGLFLKHYQLTHMSNLIYNVI